MELLGRQSSGRFYRCRMQSAAAPFLSPRTGLLVFPLGTLPPVQAFCPPVPAFLCVLCLVPSCSWGPTRGLVFDEPAAGGRDRCRSGVCLCEVEIVGKGGGAGFEPMTCSGGVLRFRARCQYCTEAKSEVICNPSPELFGSLLFTTTKPRGPPFGKSINKESRQMMTMSSFGKPAFSWMCTPLPLPSCAWTDSPPVAVLTM